MRIFKITVFFITLFLCSVNAAHTSVFDDFAFIKATNDHEAGRYSKAAPQFEKLLRSKNPTYSGSAAYTLYEYYEQGSGVPKDLKRSLQYLDLVYQSKDKTWAGLAAQVKARHAAFGYMDLVGIDRVKAYKLYLEAGEKGFDVSEGLEFLIKFPEVYIDQNQDYFYANPDSMNEVAPASSSVGHRHLREGNLEEASTILLWHARRGDGLAQQGLAVLAENFSDSESQARRRGWVLLSARNGRPESQLEYARILMEEVQVIRSEEVLEWASRAEQQGYIPAIGFLGRFWVTAGGYEDIKPDLALATKKLNEAADKNDLTSLINLGDLYSTGIAVPKDDDLAIAYYERAADLKSDIAVERLQQRYGRIYASVNSSSVSQVTDTASTTRPVQTPSLTVIPDSALLLDRRAALVIGNSSYDRAPLANPINDARLISNELKATNFDVVRVEDGTLEEMYRAIDRFIETIPKDGVALLYYAGHGVQVSGENYLIPIGTNFLSETDVKYRALNLGFILGKLEEAGSRVNIIILDACRDNPFDRGWRSQGGGLAAIDAPIGTIIAFATAPGQVAADGSGSNGLFTSELVKELRKPNQKIEDILKNTRRAVSVISKSQQVPWDSSSLTGDFYFKAN